MTLIKIFLRFFGLGCVSFGGPIAHIGYFHREFVIKLKWLSETQYSQFVSLSQVLPGPGSSQVGFCIGLHRAGLMGGLSAFLGFTLPSFVLMFGFAWFYTEVSPPFFLQSVFSSLKLVAAVIVFDAIVSMFKSFCQDWKSRSIALFACICLAVYPSAVLQISLLILSAIYGALLFKNKPVNKKGADEPKSVYATSLIFTIPFGLFIVFLTVPYFLQHISPAFTLFETFYRAGSLVFGGGHVVLPMLQNGLDGLISSEDFLVGYGAAQAVPGPMFTLATFFGALVLDQPLLGALLATLAIFLPGFLLVLALKNAWQSILSLPTFAGASWAINAYVVGLLAATFINPLAINILDNKPAICVVVLGVIALRVIKAPVVSVVLGCVCLGIIGVI